MVRSSLVIVIISMCLGIQHQAMALGMGATCTDTLLIENPVAIESYGIDTTGHWWAILRPFDKWKLLVVDGVPYGPYEQISQPVFANVGTDWVSIVSTDVRWWLVGPRRLLQTSSTIEFVRFATLTEELWWVESNGQDTRITNGERSYATGYPVKDLWVDPQGIVVWWTEKQMNQVCLIRNGALRGCSDDVILGGVWQDGRVLCALKSGDKWSVVLGDETLSTNLSKVRAIKTNVYGQVATWSAMDLAGTVKVWMYTDDFQNPWESRALQYADSAIALHPSEPLVAFRATIQGNTVVCYNSAEYPQGTRSSNPAFSHDGMQMVYSSYQDDNYIVVNGKRKLVNAGVPMLAPPLIDSKGTHAAWPSATTLVVYDLEYDILTMGKMCDVVSDAVYDWREKTFKALGMVSQRLYLLKCKL
ncbi:MAG: hypothetical protein HYX66_02665 [Ignavibacteria bacterium]|nr:hypothetical protein [Ignavibacteria bacterium]